MANIVSIIKLYNKDFTKYINMQFLFEINS